MDPSGLHFLDASHPTVILNIGLSSFGTIISIVILILLLISSALISASEIAFFSLSPAKLKDIRTNDNLKDDLVSRLLENPKKLLATILILNNLVNIAFVILSSFVSSGLVSTSAHPVIVFLIQVVVITSFLLLFAEILPKVFAARYAMQVAQLMSNPLKILIKILSPLSALLGISTSLIDKQVGKSGIAISKEELSKAIELTSDEHTPASERRILEGIVKFGDIEVKEIMKARMDVISIDSALPFDQVISIIKNCGYSRIPVFKETLDHVLGILYIKDLLAHLDDGDQYNWQSLLRSAYFVPENKKINDLLREFQEKKIHLAVVVDEFGGTSGIVTLEDVIEEIVGEISDELDLESEEKVFQKIGDSIYLFEAKTSLNDFCKLLNIEDTVFDKMKGEADTLAGLILEQTGKIPEKGFSIEVECFRFTIEAVDKRRIKKVKVTVPV